MDAHKGIMPAEVFWAHVGSLSGIRGAIRERVREEMPGYLWVITDIDSRRHRYVVCERCETQRVEVKKGRRWVNAYHQGERMACPYCGSDVTVKYMGRGYANIYDRMNVVWYQKSKIDPNAVVAIGAACHRSFDSAGDRPWQEEAEISPQSVSVIVYGAGSWRYKLSVDEWGMVGGRYRMWRPTRTSWIPVGRFGHLTFGNPKPSPYFRSDQPGTLLLVETLEEAIAGTPFARAWSERYLTESDSEDGTRALAMIAKYPCVEYMTKLGMTELLPAKLNGLLPNGLVNWRGRTITKVLGLDRQRLGELKHAGISVTPALLAVYRWMDAEGYHLAAAAAANLAVLVDRYTEINRVNMRLHDLVGFHDPGRRQKALKYVARQAERRGGTRMHLGDFIDYWRLCARYREDLNQDAVAFPSNILEAEARMRRVDAREQNRPAEEARKRQDEMISARYKDLNREYGFSFGGLTLRPARDGDEVRQEGRLLHHCVGGYVQRYANGDTVICVLRRDVNPELPWRTVEISASTGRMVQDRGYHNDTSMGMPLTPQYRAMLELFWEAWGERKKQQRRIS